jgi:hypothetical protein
MEERGTSCSRRSVLRAVSYAFKCALATAAGLLTERARAESLDSQPSDKLTKARAEYQDAPNGIYSCASCTLFVPPSICKVVAGEVSPDGWCKAFALAD